MKLKLTFLFCLVGLVGMGQITFQKTIGGTDRDYIYCPAQTADGGYIMTGETYSFGDGVEDVYLIRTDANGDTLWVKTFGGTGSDRGIFATQTTDGGYIVVGSTSSFGVGNYDVYLLKTDSNGNLQWSKTFGGANPDYGTFIQETTDGGYIITGYTGSFGAGSYDVYLIRTDSSGDSLWTKTYGGIGDDRGNWVEQTNEGGFIIGGFITRLLGGYDDFYIIKTTSNGDSLWTRSFGGTSDEVGFSIQQTSDSGYIITGDTYSFGAGGYDVYLVKTDANGNLLWSKAYGGTADDAGDIVRQTSDGGYIVVGYTGSFGAGNDDVYLIKTDLNGDTLWTRTFGGTNYDLGRGVLQTADGGYIISAVSSGFGAGNYDIYLIKTDSLGNGGCNEENTATIVNSPPTQELTPVVTVSFTATVVTSPPTIVGSGGIVNTLCTTVGIDEINHQPSTISIYPNPSTGIFYLRNNTKEEIEKTEVYNYMGEKVFEQMGNITELNLSGAAAGIYFYTVSMRDGKRAGGKMVKE